MNQMFSQYWYNKTKNDLLLIIPSMEYNSIERREKKQIGIVKPLLTIKKENNQWNCSELEKLQRRFSELIDGKFNDDTNIYQLIKIFLLNVLNPFIHQWVHIYLFHLV